MTPDPAVTAVSDERLREFAFGPRHTAPLFAEMESMARELLRARSALADVGDCKNPECEEGQVPDLDACWKPCPDCAGKQPRPAAEASLIDRVVRDLEQSGCSGTAQCIRENFRVQPVSPAAEAKCECGHAKMPGMTRCLNCNDLSPAAHTEQVTEEEREALDWAATQADEYANECDLLHYGHECAHARRARLLRRLAEQGSGAKEYKEGGT